MAGLAALTALAAGTALAALTGLYGHCLLTCAPLKGKLHHHISSCLPGRLRGREGSHAAALTVKAFKIHVRADAFVYKAPGLHQTGAVLRNDILSSEYQILGGLPISCICINITADQPCRLAADELVAVCVLSGGLIAGRAVDDHRGSCHCVGNAGRAGHPHVLADLHCHGKPRHIGAAKQQVHAHRHIFSLPFHHNRALIAGTEMARLIELRVVGQILLRHKSQKPAVLYNCCCIVELSLSLPGKSHKYQHVLSLCGLQDILQSCLCLP